MLHATASSLNTKNAEKTAFFLSDFLNFNIEKKDDQWWANNGSIQLCITDNASPEYGTLCIQSTNFDADIEQATNHPDLAPTRETCRTKNTLSQLFYCTHGINLLIFHELDEDERGELIPLPITLDWPDDTLAITQRILTVTPVAFREKARIETTEQAEYAAVTEGNLQVSLANAMTALCNITPNFQHRALYEAMEKEGINANQFLDPSSWENETYV